MATDYEKIRKKIREDYGKKGATKFGKFTSEKMYSDPTHFIFELLQNTEDVLKDAKDRKVKFTLQDHQLSLSHNGKPFDEKDVISICEYDESSKKDDDDAIGKFGVGFKSVYRFTDSPKIFSGDESFEFRDYIYPYDIKKPDNLGEDETRIILPFNEPNKQEAFDKIKEGLNNLCGRHILFLRYIKTLEWQVGDDIPSYITQEEEQDDLARFVTITEHDGTKKKWLIFSQGENKKNRVEIAFPQDSDTKTGKWKLGKVQGGKTLYSYFPIINQTTDLKFLVQGAFQTTATREAIERNHPHNIELIKHASNLLIEILRWLKRKKKLNWDVFDCLPIEKDFFDSVHDFSPMAEKIRDALKTEELLPARRGGFVVAEHARIPENEKLMTIFDSNEISKFFGNKKLCWLRAGLSPTVRNFLLRQLSIEQLELFDIMQEQHITPKFMKRQRDKRQHDKWVQNLYAFLLDEIKHDFDFDKLKALPLICLKGGGHTSSHDPYNKPQVYLPPAPKGTNTIKRATITTPKAKAFIKKLGIETYDDTNGLIDEMRKRYAESHADGFSLPDEQYEEDIERIIAIQKDEKKDKGKKDTFRNHLKSIRFVKVKNMKTGDTTWKCPEEVYIATENLETLFSGVDAYLVHNDLKKDDIREMLIHYGAKDCLQPIEIDECHLLESEEKEIFLKSNRKNRSNMRPRSYTQGPRIVNYNIKYLDAILASFFGVSKENQKNKAKALWDTLAISHSKINKQFRAKKYYTYEEEIEYDAKFISTLNKEEWILDSDGTLKRPEFVVFDNLGWDDDERLREHIIFKPSDRDEKLRAVDLTEDGHGGGKIYQELLEKEKKGMPLTDNQKNLLEAMKVESGKESQPSPKKIPPENPNTPTKQAPPQPIEMPPSSAQLGGVEIFIPDDRPSDTPESSDGGEKPPSPDGPRPPPTFNNFPDDKGDAVAKTHIEQKAIAEVQKRHRNWIDANDEHPNNPGYDFYEPDEEGNPYRWIEVKGLKGGHIGEPNMSGLQRGFALGLRAVGEGNRYIHITVAYADTENPKIRYYYNPTAKNHHRVDDEDEE